MDNVGLRWYKCDFHLHTMASRCYKNKEADTINDWIEEVKNKGLNCIAVTDHNDYRKIDEIKKWEKKTILLYFRELNCPVIQVKFIYWSYLIHIVMVIEYKNF